MAVQDHMRGNPRKMPGTFGIGMMTMSEPEEVEAEEKPGELDWPEAKGYKPHIEIKAEGD